MNAKALAGIIFGRKGWLSNLESIIGALAAGCVILGLQHFGWVLSETVIVSALGIGVMAGNQLLGNLDFFKRWDMILFQGAELPDQGPGTSNSLSDFASDSKSPNPPTGTKSEVQE